MSAATIKVVQRHPYHLVDPSPWPLFAAIGALSMTFGGMLFVFFCCYTWWRDIVREATFESRHTGMVPLVMRQNMLFFACFSIKNQDI